MPINVCDRTGKHLGVIHKRYPNTDKVFMVALTDVTAAELSVKIDSIKSYLASELGCKKLLGSIKEEKLRAEIYDIYQDEYSGILTYEELLILAFLDGVNELNIEDYINDEILKNRIRGYVLYDMDSAAFKGNSLVINEEMDYINSQIETNPFEMPLYAEVIDIPILKTEKDYIGLNSVYKYETKIKINSGNYNSIMEIQIPIHCKKGMNISFDIPEKEIIRLFCDGMIYVI